MPDPIFGESEVRSRLRSPLPRVHRTSRHRMVLGELSLALVGTTLVGVLPVSAQTVTNQSQFDAAVQQAITTSQAATINVLSPTPITADTGQCGPAGHLRSTSTSAWHRVSRSATAPVGHLTIGTGTNLDFVPTTGVARFMVGFGAGSSGTVTMTGGTITSTEAGGTIWYSTSAVTAARARSIKAAAPVTSPNGAVQIGVAGGTGTYNLSGNAALTMAGGGGTVYLGDGVGGAGVLHVSDNASFTATGQMYVGNGGAVGTITQDGANSQVVLKRLQHGAVWNQRRRPQPPSVPASTIWSTAGCRSEATGQASAISPEDLATSTRAAAHSPRSVQARSSGSVRPAPASII